MWKFFNRAIANSRGRWKRRLAVAALALVVMAAGLAVVLYLYLDSDRFREQTRRLVEAELSRQTGAEVSLGRFEWDLQRKRFELEDVTLRGSEPRDGPPLAHIARIEAGVLLRDLLDRRAHLTDLIIERPQILLLVDEDGKTNIPVLASRSRELQRDYEISIDDFKIVEGAATVNARPIAIDFAISKLNSALKYRGDTGVLSGQLSFDGSAKREGLDIPYTLAGSFDYTKGSALTHGIELRSGGSVVKAQGRIDHVLAPEITGKLEYTGVTDSRFLNHFFAKERLTGKADVTGKLDFTTKSIATSGTLSSARLDFNEWTATNVKTQYTYAKPDGHLKLTQLRADTIGGTAEGDITVAPQAGVPRVTLNLRYRDIDSAELTRIYPWDPQYRVYSRLEGDISGWFEGRFARYLVAGTAKLTAYPAKAIAETVALPIDGEGGFTARPGSVTIRNGRARFFSTSVEADGDIESAWNMKVKLSSSDLRNLFFIHRDANGSGTFEGALGGPIKTPTATGAFDIAGYKHGEWVVERMAGNARVDSGAGTAELTDVRVTEGGSTIAVTGKVALNGETADLWVESARVTAQDAAKFDRRIGERVEGAFSGKLHVTSLRPIRLEGDVEGRDVALDKRPLGEARAHIHYAEPLATITNLNVKRGAATVTGAGTYDTKADTVNFDVSVQSINLDTIRDFGIPAGVTGIVERGRFSVSGAPDRLSIKGKDVRFNEGRGAAISGDVAYAATNKALQFDLDVSKLSLDVLRTAWPELQIPASLAKAVVERGHFTGSGTTQAVEVIGKNVAVSESQGATLTGDLNYNTGTKAMMFDVDLAKLKVEVVRNVAQDFGRSLGLPESLTQGTTLERGHFAGSGTVSQPVITGRNVMVRDGRGATVSGELAYNANADTLTFEMDVTSLNLGFVREMRKDLASANLLDDVVIERGHFSGSGRPSQPTVNGKGVTISEKRGATLTGELGYNTALDKVSFDLSVAALNLDAIRHIGLPQSLTGTIQRGRLFGDITGKQPNFEGSATLRDLAFFGEAFPAAEITISRSNSSKIPVRLDAGAINLSVDIDIAAQGYPFSGNASFTRYPIERLARLRGETLQVTGRADRLEGLLTDLTRLRGSGRVETAEMQIQGRQLRSTRPFTFDFTYDRATFSDISLAGDRTSLNVAGTVSLTEKETIDLKVDGTVELSLLTADSAWPASGALELKGEIGGTIQNRNLFGIATLKNATLQPKGLIGDVTNINGEVFFNGNNVRFDEVTGNVSGGRIQVQGAATLGKDQIESMDVRIDAENVRILFPEGFRTFTDGALILRGSWAEPVLDGNLQIRNMSFNGQFENFLTLLEAPDVLGNMESSLSRLKLSLHVEGNRNITIKNELTEAQARVSLDIRGTVGSPSITGHVEARGGTLFFQGNKFEITRGNIDFVNPFVIEPIVDVQAEADVRNYRVILAITGRGENVRLEWRSDPPLPDLEVFSLITGGKTRQELIESSAQTGGAEASERMFATGAASILSDLVKNKVGGTLGLLGLRNFRIDPLPMGSEKNALARITVPVQVSKDLLITYSQDLSSGAQIILQIEYFVSKDISILATSDEIGARSLDIKRRQRF